MKLPENDYQILRLTDTFYARYPNPPYTEIMKKNTRAYNCILFQSHYDYFICVPYRTEINHRYAYRFKYSSRSKIHKSGLDYTKILIITRSEYIDIYDAVIDQDEFHETVRNLKRIKYEALKFVDDYVAHCKGIKLLHSKEFTRRYEYSSLKYFHNELGIKDL